MLPRVVNIYNIKMTSAQRKIVQCTQVGIRKHERERRDVGPYLAPQRLCYPVLTTTIAATNSSLEHFSGTDGRGCWSVGAETWEDNKLCEKSVGVEWSWWV